MSSSEEEMNFDSARFKDHLWLAEDDIQSASSHWVWNPVKDEDDEEITEMDNLALLQNFSNAQRQLSQVKQLQVLYWTQSLIP